MAGVKIKSYLGAGGEKRREREDFGEDFFVLFVCVIYIT